MTDSSEKIDTPTFPRILLCAGGTGGHLFPAIALAETLTLRGMDVFLMTDVRGQTYVPDYLFKHVYVIPSSYWQGSFAQKCRAGVSLFQALWKACRILKRLKPHAMWGFGGATTFGPILLGAFLRIPRGIYQLDAIMGRANKWLLPFVHKIATGFQEIKGLASTHKVIWAGFPVRSGIVASPYILPDMGEPFRLLVIGGSQGAKIFSNLLPKALSLLDISLQKRISLVQQCRVDLVRETHEAYRSIKSKVILTSFIADMATALKEAHLVLSRAGASTIGELACVGRPAFLIPYPHAANNHQTENARFISEAGSGWVASETEISPEKMASFLESVLKNPQTLVEASERIQGFYQKNGLFDISDTIAEWVRSDTAS